MINASSFEKLKALNCSAMADEFQNQLNNSKSYNSLGFEERLGLLVDAEWNRRQANKLKNLIVIVNKKVPKMSEKIPHFILYWERYRMISVPFPQYSIK